MTTTNGAVYPTATTAFGIKDADFLSDAGVFGGAFDNALLLAVNGNLFLNPDTTVDLTGDTLTSDTVAIVPGINAQIQYTFFTGRRVVRALFSLTNTTGSPITVDPVVLSDYGSDSRTTVRATSDGDTTIETADFWYITDDTLGNSDARITTTRYGAGAAVVPFNALTPDGVAPAIAVSGLRYPVTIAAGQTARILVFMELSNPGIPEAQAVADAADFESLANLQAAGLLTNISVQQQSEIINYVAPAASPPPVAVPVMNGWGYLALFGVLGGLGFFELRRRHQTA